MNDRCSSSEDEEAHLLHRRSTNTTTSESDLIEDLDITTNWENSSVSSFHQSECKQDTNFACTSKNDYHLKVNPKLTTVQKNQYKQRHGYFIITVSIVDVVLLIAEIIYNGGFEPLSVNPWLGVSAQTLIDFGGTLCLSCSC